MPTVKTTVNTYDSKGNITGTREITYEVSSQQINEDNTLNLLGAALAVNKRFIDNEATTNAQAIAQVKVLTRQMNGLIKLLLKQFEDAD